MAHQSRDRETRTVGSNLTESLGAVPDFFSSFSMNGAARSKEKTFPKAPIGWWGWWWWREEEVGFFSLHTLEDQPAENQEGSQESPRPTVDGERHEHSWTPRGSGQFLGGGVPWLVWQHQPPCVAMWGAVATLEILESQVGCGDKS